MTGATLGDMSALVAKSPLGTVEFDGVMVSITRTGLGRLGIGKGTKRIPVRQITAVQWKEPGFLVNGFIQFTIGGGIERRSQFGRQTVDAAEDENSVVFDRHRKAAFQAIREAIERAMAGEPYPGSAQPTIPMAPAARSVTQRMAQLQDLLAAGHITPTEFDLKREEILRQL